MKSNFLPSTPPEGGITSFYPPKKLKFFMLFTFFFYILAPLTSFKPSKTYIGVNQNEKWSVMKKFFYANTLLWGGMTSF